MRKYLFLISLFLLSACTKYDLEIRLSPLPTCIDSYYDEVWSDYSDSITESRYHLLDGDTYTLKIAHSGPIKAVNITLKCLESKYQASYELHSNGSDQWSVNPNGLDSTVTWFITEGQTE